MHVHNTQTASRLVRILTTIGAILLFWPVSASADYFLKFDGINGESKDQKHREWIDIDSFVWSITNTRAATGGGRTGTVELSDFSWSQGLDSSITGLFSAMTGRNEIRSAVVDFTNSSGTTYFKMSFDDVMLTNLALNGSGGVRPSLAGSFDYGLIRLDYWALQPNGGLGAHTWASYDPQTGKGSVAALASVYAMGLAGPSAQPVPEPETYAMLMAGLGLVGAMASRKRT
jgi:type VI secretion system secreted protein Hcp